MGKSHQNLSLSAHLLSHILGKFSEAIQVIPPAPLFHHCLQRDLQVALNNSNQDYKVLLSQSQLSQEKLSCGEKTFQIEWEAPKGQVRSSYH